MAGTFSQLYIQVVYAVKGRQNLLQKPRRDEVFKYMSGIVQNKGQKPIIINGVEDHVHLFIGLKPVMALSDLIRDVKNNTSNFINERKFVKGKFAWQEGFGAFHMPIHSWIRFINIFQTRRNITNRRLSGRNTLNFFINIKLNMMKNICLNGLIDLKVHATPSGFGFLCKLLSIKITSLRD